MGKLQMFPFDPDLFSQLILRWYCSVAFCSFIDCISGLIPDFYQLCDAIFGHLVVGHL